MTKHLGIPLWIQHPKKKNTWCKHATWRGGGLGSSTTFKNLMSPTPRRKWYLMTGRRAHWMVLDPIPQSLPVHFFGSRPQPPTSRDMPWHVRREWVMSRIRTRCETSKLANMQHGFATWLIRVWDMTHSHLTFLIHTWETWLTFEIKLNTETYFMQPSYGVSTISRLLKIIGLFCKRTL